MEFAPFWHLSHANPPTPSKFAYIYTQISDFKIFLQTCSPPPPPYSTFLSFCAPIGGCAMWRIQYGCNYLFWGFNVYIFQCSPLLVRYGTIKMTAIIIILKSSTLAQVLVLKQLLKAISDFLNKCTHLVPVQHWMLQKSECFWHLQLWTNLVYGNYCVLMIDLVEEIKKNCNMCVLSAFWMSQFV